jgi:hypothetical protein
MRTAPKPTGSPSDPLWVCSAYSAHMFALAQSEHFGANTVSGHTLRLPPDLAGSVQGATAAQARTRQAHDGCSHLGTRRRRPCSMQTHQQFRYMRCMLYTAWIRVSRSPPLAAQCWWLGALCGCCLQLRMARLGANPAAVARNAHCWKPNLLAATQPRSGALAGARGCRFGRRRAVKCCWLRACCSRCLSLRMAHMWANRAAVAVTVHC